MPIGDNNGIENAYMVDADGNIIGKVGNIETVTMAVMDEDVQPIAIQRDFNFGFTAKWKSDKTSRKAFCRELVKLGYTKNEAKKVAWTVKGKYGQHLPMIRLCGSEYVNKLNGGRK